MDIDLSTLSSEELRELSKSISARLIDAERRDIARAAEQIEAIAKSLDLSVPDLIERAGLLNPKIKRGSKAGVKSEQIYRDPNNSSVTWSGRGRQPKWVREYLDQGGKIEGLRIKQ